MDRKLDVTPKLYAPVVSVVGHVDHGKTTLLDALSKTSIVRLEHGGITQKIGASEIDVLHEGKKRKITLIDTPGHVAFSNMRSFGVSASDIALLIVAADDGVMPQTRDSIKVIKDAGIPFIVVITKKDLESSDIEKVKRQLLSEEVLLEGLGGDVPNISVSAVRGEGIQELVDLILLVYDLSAINKNEKDKFLGIIIESKLDKKRGILTTIVVKTGTLSIQDPLFQEEQIGKVKSLINPQNIQVKSAMPGDAISCLGVEKIVQTGSIVLKEKIKGSHPISITQEKSLLEKREGYDLTKLFAEQEKPVIKIVLKTETSAEAEAIKNSLPQGTEVVLEGQGDITFSDVLIAKDFSAFVIGFNVKIVDDAERLAKDEKVFFRLYSIIYELIDELNEAVKTDQADGQEKILGQGTIIASFVIQDGKVLGVSVNEGRLRIQDKIKILRGKVEKGRSTLTSLRRGKQEVKEVGKGLECGVVLTPEVDFNAGDAIIAYND